MKLKDVIKFFKKYFYKEKKIIIKSFFLIFIGSLIGILYGYLIGLAIDKAVAGSFGIAVIILIARFILNAFDDLYFNRLGKIYLAKMSNNMMEDIGYEVYYKVGLLPAIAFEEKTSGELINRITQDAANITDTFQQLLRTIVTLWSSLLVFIYICFNSWVVALEVILYVIVFYFFSKKFLPEIKENQKAITKEKDVVVANVNESIRGIREIRALGIRNSLNKTIKKNIRNIYSKMNKQMINERNYNAAVGCLCDFLESLVFITCIILIILKKSSFAFFMTMTYYIYRFMGTVEQITALSTSYQKMRVSIERIDEIINNRTYTDESFGSLHKTDIKGNIEFKNITFRYKNEEQNIFENLNLTIPSNKKVAIVGKSGQGKTSILICYYVILNQMKVLF